MARIPFKERLWCSPDDAGLFIRRGKTLVFARIRSGEIVSRLDGRSRMVHVPSLIARYGLNEDQIEAGKTNEAQTKAEVRGDSGASSTPAVNEIKHSTKGRKVRNEERDWHRRKM